MARERITKLTVLAILLFTIIVLPSTTKADSTNKAGPIVSYQPSMPNSLNSTRPAPWPSMPLPTPYYGPNAFPAPVSGNLRVLVIAAAFSDIQPKTSIASIQSVWTNQVAKYFEEISYSKVTMTVTVVGWFTLPHNEAYYGKDCPGEPGGGIDDPGCTGQDFSWSIAQDAADVAERNVTFANYDYYVFVHSGNGEESSGLSNDIWSVTYMGGITVNPCQDVQQGCNQVSLSQFSVVSELQAGGAVPMGVNVHEFLHLLSLPDLFNTNTGKSILGPWSTLDAGTWNGNPPGSSPAHLIAWGKIQLGFISGSMLKTANPGVTSSFTIDPTELASNNVHAVEIPIGSTTNPSEYYLIEVRADIGFDSALPAFGILITFVNNNAVVGPIQIVDGHPNVPGLEDAVWNVGQTFTDTKDGFDVAITGKVGNSYQVTVNRSGQPPTPQPQNQTYIYLAISGITAQPATITLPNTTVTITAQIYNSGTEAANNVPIQVNLNGEEYTITQVSVSAGSTSPVTFTWVSMVGTNTFTVIIDPNETIDNANRSNNSQTFTVNVGPTLTINIPLNISATGNVWIKINGIEYNITSDQFQTSVPSGKVAVEIEPYINTTAGVRQSFTGWSDGSAANPRNVTIGSNTVLGALYTTQYLLTVNSNGGTTTPSGWYTPNTTVTVSAANPSNVTANASRYIFTSWTGDLTSASTAVTVTMNKPVELQANWLKQFYVTVISPTGSPTGAGWYNAGTVVTVGVQSTVQYPNGTRMIFHGWNSTVLTGTPTSQITVNSAIVLLAEWQTQYLVTINSVYGSPSGSGWYNIGSSAVVSVQPEINYPNMTRREFDGWIGEYGGTENPLTMKVDAPITLDAEWSTQYLVTFSVVGLPNSTILTLDLNNATYNFPASSTSQSWIEQGTEINPTVNQTITNGIMNYKFMGWRNSTDGIMQNPLAVNSPVTYTASFAPTLSLPPIPGFPIAAIVLGFLTGSLILATRRNRTKNSSPKQF